MPKAITAKVKLYRKTPVGDGQTGLKFMAPYTDADGNRINEDWAKYTPALHIDITVIDSVAEGMDVDQHYTLTFTPE